MTDGLEKISDWKGSPVVAVYLASSVFFCGSAAAIL